MIDEKTAADKLYELIDEFGWDIQKVRQAIKIIADEFSQQEAIDD